jgi:hypothetical protein
MAARSACARNAARTLASPRSELKTEWPFALAPGVLSARRSANFYQAHRNAGGRGAHNAAIARSDSGARELRRRTGGTDMAVTMVQEMPGATQELYDKILDHLGIGPEGALIGASLPTSPRPWTEAGVWSTCGSPKTPSTSSPRSASARRWRPRVGRRMLRRRSSFRSAPFTPTRRDGASRSSLGPVPVTPRPGAWSASRSVRSGLFALYAGPMTGAALIRAPVLQPILWRCQGGHTRAVPLLAIVRNICP